MKWKRLFFRKDFMLEVVRLGGRWVNREKGEKVVDMYVDNSINLLGIVCVIFFLF